jgi:hypothetical protein
MRTVGFSKAPLAGAFFFGLAACRRVALLDSPLACAWLFFSAEQGWFLPSFCGAAF